MYVKAIKNCTPHPITLIGWNDRTITIQPEEVPARCSTFRQHTGEVQMPMPEGPGNPLGRTWFSVEVTDAQFGEVTGLPEPERGTILVVSRVVAEAMRGRRHDLVVVDDTVRDDQGRIVGAKAISYIH